MSEPTGQFRPLLRNFVRQFLDNELTSAEGNVLDSLTQILALLAAANVCLCYLFTMKYAFGLGDRPLAQRQAAAWADQEFLISLSMAVAACITVPAWDYLFGDRRDAVILTSLPVRMRTMFAARVVSVLFLIVCAVAAANGLSSLLFPWLVLGGQATWPGYFRYAGAQALAVSAAAVFAFAAVLALHGMLIAVLPYRWFRRISAYAQLAVLLLVLSLFFLMPRIAHPAVLARPENLHLALKLPPFWFLAWYQELLGGAPAWVAPLAGAARSGLLLAAGIAAATYAAAYPRHVRKLLEEQELAPARRLRLPLARWICRRPVERAAFEFASRTMLRHRRPRLLLAVYATVGLAYVFDGVSALLRDGGAAFWSRPAVQSASVPLILSFFLFLGMRVLFRYPVELKSNWVFQVNGTGLPEQYLAGARRVVTVYGIVPVALATFPLYVTFWGWAAALRHLTLVLLLQLLLIEWLFRSWDRIPFTCQFVPGKANLKTRFAIYWVWFSVVAFLVTNLETWAVVHVEVYRVALPLLMATLALAVRRRRARERAVDELTYEEQSDWRMLTLELS